MPCLEQIQEIHLRHHLMDLNGSTDWRNEETYEDLQVQNPQENYQNTTASSLFCKTANDQVISK